MSYSEKTFDFIKMSSGEFEKVRQSNGWGLTLDEFRQAQKQSQKPLTITESYILDSLWSDHCSYKHSRYKLKDLVKENRYVLKTKNSDAGAVKIADSGYCAVFKIESHNHPTLINPFDGAATGVGGILRDVFAMGAENIGVGASLRYGPPESKNSKDVLSGSMEGAASYCSVMGIPLLALDVYYEESFKHNCLMNVSALGIVKSDEIIPNVVSSKNGVGYNLIYIGKPTAGAAVGGASFASQAFEEGKKKEIEFGSNPALEEATFNVFKKVKNALKKKKLLSYLSVKDMGAAGLTCSTVEQVAPAGYGIEILTDKVPVPKGKKVHPLALAVGEDQERNMLIAPDKATEVILKLFKNDRAFKRYGGKVAVIGKVIKENRFIIKNSKNKVYCDIPLSMITNSPLYKPKGKKPKTEVKNKFRIPKPKSLSGEILKVIGSENVSFKKEVFNILSSNSKNCIVKKPDETDVCILAPLKYRKADKKHKKIGVALVFGGKSIQGRDGNAEEQAYLATVIARLKLAAAGLKPVAAADGCNYGNPDNPEHYYSFSKGIDGLNKGCRIPLYKEKNPLAVVAGNVSLKNTYVSKGQEVSIDPSLVPVVFGYIKDYRKTVTTGLKSKDSLLFLAGKRKQLFKGSEYARLYKQSGRSVASVSPSEAGSLEYAALEVADKGLVISAAVIESGGLAAALTRMILMSKLKKIGVELNMDSMSDLREDYALFTESIGYVLEVDRDKVEKVKKIYKKYGVKLFPVGRTTEKGFSGFLKKRKVFELSTDELKKHWIRK